MAIGKRLRRGVRFMFVWSLVVGTTIFAIALLLGVPMWLSLGVAIVGAFPVTVALVVATIAAWGEVTYQTPQAEARQRAREEARRGREHLDRVRRGRD